MDEVGQELFGILSISTFPSITFIIGTTCVVFYLFSDAQNR